MNITRAVNREVLDLITLINYEALHQLLCHKSNQLKHRKKEGAGACFYGLMFHSFVLLYLTTFCLLHQIRHYRISKDAGGNDFGLSYGTTLTFIWIN